MKVSNMVSARGNTVPNQFIVTTDAGDYFQSYDSVIAFRHSDGSISLDRHYWDYSVTTGRYRNEFLNEGIAQTRKKIESGEYKLKDLNS